MDYELLANEEAVKKVESALKDKGYDVTVVKTGAKALDKIKDLIPEGATTMNGSSVTLEQIGYFRFIESGQNKWKDLHGDIRKEDDPIKRTELRRKATLSDFYLGSVHALTYNGEFIVASNTASQIPHIAYTSPNLIFVVSTKKIVPDIESGFKRLENYVYPLVDKDLMDKYGKHTAISKVLVFKREPEYLGRKIHFILVNENLGY